MVGLFFVSCAPSRHDYRDIPSVSRQYAPAYPPAYQPYYAPYSGSYQNPYNLPPNNYHPYYDQDYYYVPPTEYRHIEQRPSVKFDQRDDPNEKL